MQQQTVLVVGGAGFLGSAISKAALSKGWRVLSISPSGTPFTSPAGHRPAWSSSPNIEWHAADALDPASYKHLADRSTAAVHTVGILLESDYKSKQSGSAIQNTLAGLAKGWGFRLPGPDDRGNPLRQAQNSSSASSKLSYETMNRDSAISVAHTFLRSLLERGSTSSAPFVYISAEDLFRPVVDARYIRTKRQAEAMIARLAVQASPQSSTPSTSASQSAEEVLLDADGAGLTGELRDETLQDQSHAQTHSTLRPIFLRPGLMYHPHTRPGSTLPAAILEASAAFHRTPPLPLPIPTPAQMLAKWGGSSLQSMSKLMTTPPLHIDTVAKAVCAAIEDSSVQGPVDVYGIRRLAGWKDPASMQGAPQTSRPFSTQALPTMPHKQSPPSHRSITTWHALPKQHRRTFFSLNDLSRFATNKVSPQAPAQRSNQVEGRSYRDTEGNAVYEARKTLPYSPALLFEVVADMNSYKHFVPYCKDSRILADPPPPSTDTVFADLTVGYGSFHETFRSKVTAFQPTADVVDSRVVAESVQPNPIFSHLVTEWRFRPANSGDHTLVQFSIVYTFRNPLYNAVAGGVFEKLSAKIMTAFEERASQLTLQRNSK